MKKLLILVLFIFVLVGCNANTTSIKTTTNTDNTTSKINTSNILVAYFSVTNNTEKIANNIKKYLNSDIFEIIPKEEYTSEDINYNNDCRANREQNDPSSRPEIKNQIDDISKYDTIILGYPIWWGQTPKIMYTFIESYDFSNKTIIPFCTSGSSPIGSSATNLSKSATSANWLDGKRFSANASISEISSWLDQYINKEKEMKLLIDDKEVNVTWENNNSVKELMNLLPITINMHEYGGFEQTGSIGASIKRSDTQMDVVAGDIVLYNGNAISVFYAPSSWSYTKLGHINLSTNELNELLNKSSVVITLK